MKRSEIFFGILRIPSDAIAVSGSLLLAYWLRTNNIDLIPGIQILEPAQTLPSFPYFAQYFFFPCILLFLIIAGLLKLYLIRVTLSAFREEARIILSVIVWVGLIMGWFFFVKKQLFFSRALLLHATIFITVSVSIGRMVLTIFQRILLNKDIGVRTVISMGTISLPNVVEEFLQRDPRYKYIGHTENIFKKCQTERSRSIFTSLDSARDDTNAFSKDNIDLILQTDPNTSEKTNAIIDFCRSHHIGYAFLPPVLVDVPHLLSVYRFGPVPILRFRPTPLDGWGAVMKRAGDIKIAALALIVLSPLFCLIALLVKLSSKGPIFYRSKRIGQHGNKLVTVLKFRSMVQNADELKPDLMKQSHRTDGPLFKIKNDPRVTFIGKMLRHWSLDELPQLWNVLTGSLSLIGPRPHLPEEVDRYTDFQKRVFAVKPGITGLAQISGRSNLPFEEEVRLDLQYVEEWTPLLDLWILWRTVWVVFKGDGAD